LREAGIDSLEAVVDAGPERLESLTGFDRKTCVALVRVAQSALFRNMPGVIEFKRPEVEAPIGRLARGLEAARLVEKVLGLVRKARSHVGKEPAQPSWADAHRRARKQLKRLAESLALVQEDILSDGLSEQGLSYLRRQLSPLDASLRSVIDAKPRRRTLKRTARVAKRARRELDSVRLG
jgi:hypothetical protein